MSDPDTSVRTAASAVPQPYDEALAPSSGGGRNPLAPAGAPNLAAALAAAQGEIKNPAKENIANIKSDKGAYQYRYTTLADGLDAIKGPLSKHGIATVQCTSRQGDLLVLTTRLIHDSGESVECDYPVGNWTKLSHQQMGSALTYARRYSLFSIVGISGSDDDDDGAAVATAPIDDPVIDMDDIVYVETLIRDTETDLAKFLSFVKAPSVAEMRLSHFKQGVPWLERKKRKAAADGATVG